MGNPRRKGMALLLFLLGACGTASTASPVPVQTPLPSPPTPSTPSAPPAPTPPPILSPVEARYLLIDRFGPVGEAGGIHYCDPDAWPVAASEERVQKRAEEQFPYIQQDEAFAAILGRLGLAAKTAFSPEEVLAIYQEYKKLAAVQVERADGGYTFQLAVYTAGQGGAPGGAGKVLRGTVSPTGEVRIEEEEEARLSCPRCLAAGSRIATPAGPVEVQRLRPGDTVWTMDRQGRRRPAVVQRVVHLAAPPGHGMVYLRLDDGRELLVSPGHPLADGRPAGELTPGDRLDGSVVLSAGRVTYRGQATYDLLPAGETGLYWANGILLRSTLGGHGPP